jgi:transketolase
MANAELHLAAIFQQAGHSLVDHTIMRNFKGELILGIASEAASLLAL